MQIGDVSRDGLRYGCAQFCQLSSFSQLAGQKTRYSVHSKRSQALDLYMTNPIGFALDVKPLSGGSGRRRNIEQRGCRLTYAHGQSAIALLVDLDRVCEFAIDGRRNGAKLAIEDPSHRRFDL